MAYDTPQEESPELIHPLWGKLCKNHMAPPQRPTHATWQPPPLATYTDGADAKEGMAFH
jgi:hypothetical protein